MNSPIGVALVYTLYYLCYVPYLPPSIGSIGGTVWCPAYPSWFSAPPVSPTATLKRRAIRSPPRKRGR
jgi:hypothetical protein